MKLLEELRGRRVDVWTVRGQSEIKDSGKLVDFDEQVIKLEVSAGEFLYISRARIRLMKPYL